MIKKTILISIASTISLSMLFTLPTNHKLTQTKYKLNNTTFQYNHIFFPITQLLKLF